jgi:hypothetical protein
MITHDLRWSLPRGNTPVPSRWQATRRCFFWSSLTGITAWMPWRRSQARFAREEYALSAIARPGRRRTFAERLADRQSLTIPSHDPGYGHLGQAFPP